MAAAMETLTAEMAAKAHIDAVNRDYICEPRLGAYTGGGFSPSQIYSPSSLRVHCARALPPVQSSIDNQRCCLRARVPALCRLPHRGCRGGAASGGQHSQGGCRGPCSHSCSLHFY